MKQRQWVPEWRIKLYYGRWAIRLWIEADPKHGGVSRSTAQITAELALRRAVKELGDSVTDDKLARAIAERCLGINSVEVCDHNDMGAAIHKDWP